MVLYPQRINDERKTRIVSEEENDDVRDETISQLFIKP